MAKKKNKLIIKKPNASDKLKGLDFTINTFGEINLTYDIDKINDFLNSHVEDKKLNEKTISDGEAKK